MIKLLSIIFTYQIIQYILNSKFIKYTKKNTKDLYILKQKKILILLCYLFHYHQFLCYHQINIKYVFTSIHVIIIIVIIINMKRVELTSPIQFKHQKPISKLPTSSSNPNFQIKINMNVPVKQQYMKNLKSQKENFSPKQAYFALKPKNNENQNKQNNQYSKVILNDIRNNKNFHEAKSHSYKNLNIQLSKKKQPTQNKTQSQFKSSYMTKRIEHQKMSEKKYQRNSFDRLTRNQKGLSLNTNDNHNHVHYFQQNNYQISNNAGKQNIEKLNEKLNSLENRISNMKREMEKKKEQKKNLLDQDFKDRKQRDLERMDREKGRNSFENINNKQRGLLIQIENKRNLKFQNNQKQLNQSRLLQEVVTKFPKQNKELFYFNKDPYSPRHNIYYVSEIVRAYKQKNSLSRQHLLTSLNIIKMMSYSTKVPSNQEMDIKKVKLPKSEFYKDKKTIIFDLDQTLIHCNDTITLPHDVKINITFPNGETAEAGINIRPYAFEILKNLSKNFQIIVFTASHSCYANLVIDYLDPEKKYIQHRLFREHCYATAEGVYVKDLRVIPRNLKDIVLIDNAAYSYFFQLDNGIPIIPYYQGKNDYELKALEGYIQKLQLVNDVRIMNNKTFKLKNYINYDEQQSLVKELYIQC